MSSLRSRTGILIAVLILAALALRPVAPVERAADLLFTPARWLTDLARPLAFLEIQAVRAALSDAERALAAERDAAHALIAAQIHSALPRDPALRAERAFLVAEVLERAASDTDLVRVRFPAGIAVEPDMPVTAGDVYVGRVLALDRARPGEAIVQLVTHPALRVGAAVEPGGGAEPVRLVAGGVVRGRDRRSDLLLLGAQHASREVRTGTVRVLEMGDGERTRRRACADGFHLGRLVSLAERGRSVLGIETGFDYQHGLAQVAIVGGPEFATDGPALAEDAFDPAAWTPVRVRLAGDATPGRHTRSLSLPSGARVEPGAALALGARFVGRVLAVQGASATAALLADPGLGVAAVAQVEGARDPLHLGRLVSLGAGPDGSVRMRWHARAHAGERPAGRARIATSSGERGVPAGLWIGTCVLPAGPGVHEIDVVPAQAAAHLLRFSARLAPADLAQEGP